MISLGKLEHRPPSSSLSSPPPPPSLPLLFTSSSSIHRARRIITALIVTRSPATTSSACNATMLLPFARADYRDDRRERVPFLRPEIVPRTFPVIISAAFCRADIAWKTGKRIIEAAARDRKLTSSRGRRAARLGHRKERRGLVGACGRSCDGNGSKTRGRGDSTRTEDLCNNVGARC